MEGKERMEYGVLPALYQVGSRPFRRSDTDSPLSDYYSFSLELEVFPSQSNNILGKSSHREGVCLWSFLFAPSLLPDGAVGVICWAQAMLHGKELQAEDESCFS